MELTAFDITCFLIRNNPYSVTVIAEPPYLFKRFDRDLLKLCGYISEISVIYLAALCPEIYFSVFVRIRKNGSYFIHSQFITSVNSGHMPIIYCENDSLVGKSVYSSADIIFKSQDPLFKYPSVMYQIYFHIRINIANTRS
ncbi:MAG: hypothetical protein BWY61_02139 [Firmicutes bacterium ADurb.Bin354]|nr:MAG: hypothetical protein BWY61_02139 [Firmicutes bacterium ADurb.Bin354]